MGKMDITRSLSGSSKGYIDARMQQGRSLLDSDWNEGTELSSEVFRSSLLEILGVVGSTNAGLSVGEVTTFVEVELPDGTPVTTYDFGLQPGSFYLGGVRVVVDDDEETFLTQVDWLQIDADADRLPIQPTAQGLLGPPNKVEESYVYYAYEPGLEAAKRFDLVYVEVWEQAVTAVEDRELRERALGGPDTSARIRRMRRVQTLTDLPSDTLSELGPQLASYVSVDPASGQTVGTFDESRELVSAARLTVLPITEPGSQPCGPKPPSGYTGHEDQAIRVELRGPRSLTWGFGNSAPLYRAKIGNGRIVTLLNHPRDPSRYPRAGQIAELIPWGSKLPNDEKVAELTGDLVRIGVGYDPATGSFELAEGQNPSSDLVAWHTNHTEHWSERDESTPDYVYVRIWDRGPDVDSPALIPVDGIVPIGHTGLELRLGGAGKSGDYWIIAARRGTPETVVPWQLLSSEAPHGPRRFYTPLALLTWEAPLSFGSAVASPVGPYFSIPVSEGQLAVYGPVQAKVRDLRRQLIPLCIRGCATVTVGDSGNLSTGMVSSLADALDMLPPEGGEIKLLRGAHEVEDIVLDARSNITISGCGLDSTITPAIPATAIADDIYNQGSPLLSLQDCTNIVLENFVVEGKSAVGVKLTGANSNIRISGLRFEMEGLHVDPGLTALYALAQAAILGLGGDEVTIERCHIGYTDTLNYTPGIVYGGTRLRIRDNYVSGGAESMGGIHILSYSQDVELSGNTIRGGWGHGIALGHLLDINVVGGGAVTIDAPKSWADMTRMLGDVLSNIHVYSPNDDQDPIAGDLGDWTPGGPLADLRIRDNRILGMGISGISTGGFCDTQNPRSRFVVVSNLEIRRNEIAGNMQITSLSLPRFFACDICVGGVCLAAVVNLQLRENTIRDNGADYETPTVGVGVVTGQALVIQDNLIVDNGLEHAMPNTDDTTIGLRGGVAICEVTGIRDYTFPEGLTDVTITPLTFTAPTTEVAILVHKNEVRHRLGKALWIITAFGPIVVTENSLHSLGDPATGVGIPNSELCLEASSLDYEARGATVEIRAYALSPALEYEGSFPRLSYADPATPGFEQIGGIDFSANEVSLEWAWDGGFAASVLLSSLDAVRVTDNVMQVDMANSFTVPEPDPAADDDQEFLDAVKAAPGSHSFVMANCWAGASSTVQASGNRFVEGRWDCLFSYVGGHAAAFGAEQPNAALTTTKYAASMSSNIGTHCLIQANPPNTVDANNIVLHEVIPGCAAGAVINVKDGDQTVCVSVSGAGGGA